MRYLSSCLAAALALAAWSVPGRADETARPTGSWTFEADKPGTAPTGFAFALTGEGRPGRWTVRTEKDAPSGTNVLAQTDADGTDYRFPIAVAESPVLRDVRLTVKCKAVSGKVDQACGLVFRYQDANNYYIVRANALEGNIRLYIVKDGERKQIAGVKTAITSNSWHDYRVEAKGSNIAIFWDGQQVLSVENNKLPEAGRIGLWTKADSVSYFDDLEVAPL